MKDLTKGNITKQLFAFAIPLFLGSILQLTYSLVDTRIVGSTLGESALAAVGATTSLSNLLIGFLLGLTNGFAVIAAQRFGAGNYKELRRAVALSATLGLIMSLILTVLSLVFLYPLLHAMNIPEAVMPQSASFISIIFAGMTFMMLYNVCASVLRAIGDSVTPLIFLAVSVVLNIFGDLFFIKVLHSGVRGAAIATVLSQIVALISCVIYMWKKYEFLRFSLSDIQFDKEMIHNLLSCGFSMGFMSSFVALGTVALQTSINRLGTDIIVAHTAARKITELYMLAFSVMGTTMATFCGQNLGAMEIGRIKEGIKKAIIITWICSAITVLLSYTIAPQLIYAITGSNNPVVVDNASLYLKVDTLLYFVTALICVIRNAMQGIGDHITPIVSSFIELAGKVLIAAFLVPHLGYMGVILAEPIVWVLMVIPLIVQILRAPILKTKKRAVA